MGTTTFNHVAVAARRLPAPAILVGVVALVIALGYSAPAPAAAPVSASGSDQPEPNDQPEPKNCVSAEEARIHAAGDSGEEGGAPKFTAAFYKRLFLLNVSMDGADGSELPISIEEVCSVPKRLKKQAAQLAGGDGVALLLPRTAVWQGETQLTG